MGIEALTTTDEGQSVEPRTDRDWLDWVSASNTRNYCLQDPLVDWLHSYGEEKGFKRDTDLPGYDSRTDFTRFILKKGREFEDAVIKWLGTRIARPIIQNDNQIYRLIIEKASAPKQSHGLGHLIVRRLSR